MVRSIFYNQAPAYHVEKLKMANKYDKASQIPANLLIEINARNHELYGTTLMDIKWLITAACEFYQIGTEKNGKMYWIKPTPSELYRMMTYDHDEPTLDSVIKYLGGLTIDQYDERDFYSNT